MITLLPIALLSIAVGLLIKANLRLRTALSDLIENQNKLVAVVNDLRPPSELPPPSEVPTVPMTPGEFALLMVALRSSVFASQKRDMLKPLLGRLNEEQFRVALTTFGAGFGAIVAELTELYLRLPRKEEL